MTRQTSDTFWADYITEAMSFAVLPVTDPRAKEEAFFGLIEEAGEVAGVFKRAARGDNGGELDLDKLTKELGDLLWYTVRHIRVHESVPVNRCADMLGVVENDPRSKPTSESVLRDCLQTFLSDDSFLRVVHLFTIARFASLDLREVATKNLEKLRARRSAGTIQGSGDNR